MTAGPRCGAAPAPAGRSSLPWPTLWPAMVRRPPASAAPFLTPQIKQHAAELVQGLTGSPEGIAKLASRSAKLLPPLFRLVPAPEATSRAALVALVNLSQAGAA